MGAIERIDIAFAVGDLRPADRLNSARDFKRKLVEFLLTLNVRNSPFPHQAPKISVSGDIIESMIVYSDVGHVRCHALDRPVPANFQEALFSRGIELEQRG